MTSGRSTCFVDVTNDRGHRAVTGALILRLEPLERRRNFRIREIENQQAVVTAGVLPYALMDELVGRCGVAQDRLAWLDTLMTDAPYLCGKRFSAADIWLYVWLHFGQENSQPFNSDLKRIGPWFERMAATLW